MRTAAKSTIFIASLALGLGALTGCAGGQSVADACKVIQDEGSSMSTAMSDAMSSVGTDPDAAAKALDDAEVKLKELGDKITNDQVKPIYTDFLDAYGDISGILGDVAEDPSTASDAMSKINDVSKKIQDSTSELQKVCS